MKLRQLRYLTAIVDNGLNITSAAAVLFTSQSGISKQIRMLEDELGLQLFVRKGKSLAELTHAGWQVLRRARQILAETENIKAMSSQLAGEKPGEMIISTTPTQARYVLPDMLEMFQRQYPDVSLRLHQGTSEQIVEQVLNGEADFAIASGQSDFPGELVTIPMYSWERVILVPGDHPLTGIERPRLTDIVRYPIISYTYSFNEESSLGKVFDDAGVDPNVVFTTQDPDTIKTYVRKGMGIGILACMAYDKKQDHDLTAINTGSLFPGLTTWVGFRKDRFLSEYMYGLLERLVPVGEGRGLTQTMRDYMAENNVVAFPGSSSVQKPPVFPHQFKTCCESGAGL